MKKMKKKGQLDLFGSLAIGIAVLAITLIVAFMILSEGKEAVKSNIDSVNVYNETVTWSNNTFVTLATDHAFELTCSQVLNNSGTHEVIPVSNYTCDPRGLELNATLDYTATVNVTYSFKNPDSAYNGTSTMQDAADSVPGWVPIVIITAIGGALILMVKKYRG